MNFFPPTISKQNISSGTSEIDFCLLRSCHFRDFWTFFLNYGQWVDLFFFSEMVNSRQTASLLLSHKSHCQLVSSLNSCATQAQTKADKRLFRWINEHAHACTNAEAEMCMQTVAGSHFPTCFSHSVSHLSLSLLFCLTLFPLSPPSIPPVTKGVFLFKGPQKPLGTQSRNCYNWWRRGEALGTRKSHILIMLAEIGACSVSECFRKTCLANCFHE